MISSKLRILQANNKACTRCDLAPSKSCSGATQIVAGQGTDEHRFMIVGEAPGLMEDSSGMPFVGRSGKLLDKLLSQANINREGIYVTNTVHCRPTVKNAAGRTSNRTPTENEINICKWWLFQELKIVNPVVVVTLGKIPTRLLLKIKQKQFRLSDYIGKAHKVDYMNHFNVVPCWHPSYLLRNGSKMDEAAIQVMKIARKVWEDEL